MRIIMWSTVGVLVAATAWYVFAYSRSTDETYPDVDNEEEIVACTMEAKICPDGTAVGRQGPRCEFAPCPGGESTPDPRTEEDINKTSEISREIAIGETVVVGGISITPLHVVEDSRCPVNANCVWQGRVRLETRIVSGMGATIMTLEQQMPITTEAEQVTLISVAPAPRSEKPTDPSTYRFTFEVASRANSI